MNRTSLLILPLFLITILNHVPTKASDSLAAMANGQQDCSGLIRGLIEKGKGAIEFPAGVFRIDKTIEIDLNKTGYCHLRGCSGTKIQMTGSGPAFLFRGSHFKSADPSGFSDAVWERERMPLIENFAIEGMHPKADGIAAVGTMQLTISQMHLRKLRHGILLQENNRNLIINACHIYENSGVGIFYDNVNLHQSNIVGCHISYCDQGGLVSRGGNVRNIHITGCDLESNMSADQAPTANVLIDCRESDYGTAEVAITGCTIQHNSDGPDSANIRIIGSSNSTDDGRKRNEGHVTITGNVLSDVQRNVWLEGCRGVTLTGNTFWMGYEYNLFAKDSSHIIVGANNFDRNPRYDYGDAKQTINRLSFENCRDCTLSSLHIAAIKDGFPALSIVDCDRMHVSGLTILDCEIAIKLSGVSRSRFSDCFIRDDPAGQGLPQLSISDSVANSFDDSLKDLLPNP